jgi:transposase
MASITLDLDLPDGVTVEDYRRQDDAHALQVTWPLPDRCTCQRCGHTGPARLEWKDEVRAVRDLDLWNQPCFWVYQVGYHRCQSCQRRQHLLPPFKRPETSYTYRFEGHVVRLLIGSTEEEVARRLGISAETVGRIVQYQIADAKAVDPGRVFTDLGIDELSLKKRHKLYATLLTDLSDPARPRVVAVAKGKDEAAALECLDKLSEAQRAQVKTYRVDMGPAFAKAAQARLPNAKAVADRFHVAQKFNDVIDAERKKNHAGVQEEADAEGAEGVPVADVGVPPRPPGPDGRGAGAAGGAVRAPAAAEDAVRAEGALQGDL